MHMVASCVGTTRVFSEGLHGPTGQHFEIYDFHVPEGLFMSICASFYEELQPGYNFPPMPHPHGFPVEDLLLGWFVHSPMDIRHQAESESGGAHRYSVCFRTPYDAYKYFNDNRTCHQRVLDGDHPLNPGADWEPRRPTDG
jgi:hypothetical protein